MRPHVIFSFRDVRWVSLLGLVVIASSISRGLAADEPAFDAAAEEAAIKAIRSFASNIQKNRDGSVRFVRFSKAVATDEHVRQVAAFSQLDYLAVVTPQISDDGLESLAQLKNLDTLCLAGANVTDVTAVKAAELPKLQRLYLAGPQITDRTLAALAGHPQLNVLELNGTAITDASAEHLASLSQLKTLSLSGTAISDATLQQLAGLESLEYLVLRDVEVGNLTPLAALPKLKVLDVSGVKLQREQLSALRQCKSLKHVIALRADLTSADEPYLRDESGGPRLITTPRGTAASDALTRYLAGESLRAAGEKGKVEDLRSSSHDDIASPVPAPRELPPARVRFADANHDETPDFQRHVIPLLGRLGCNGRTCHGSFQGQGGFRLSMFGYDFAADWKAIQGDDYPRVDTQAPDDSLLLQKPTEVEPHEGGQRFEPNGWEHALLRRWIAAGAKPRSASPAKLLRFVVEPAEIVFADENNPVQLTCWAEWSDGVREDVTCLCRFQSNSDSVAEVDSDGRVRSVGPGDTHVIAFYDQGVFAVPVLKPYAKPRAADLVRLESAAATDAGFAPARAIDRFIDRKLAKLGLPASPQADDAEYFRRVSLDLTGTLPTPVEIESFVDDPDPDKRAALVDRLLQTPAYVEWWTMRLADLTGSNAQSLGSTDMNSPAAGQWVSWLRRRVRDNVGWDRIAAGMILATSRRPGQAYADYAAEQSRHLSRTEPTDFTALENPMHYYWFRSNNQTPSDRALAFSYVFLGVRLECAQCHKHPFDRWSQEDFNQFTQFFTRIKAGVAPDARDSQWHLKQKLGVPEKLDTAALRRQMYLRVSAEGLPIPWNEIWIESPRSEKPQLARLLGGESFDLNAFADPREPLFQWLTSADNPYFAKAMVNRIWAHYFGRGLVHPPDDFNQANPASHPGLLDWLAKDFAENGYDLQRLHRTITLSNAYQRSSFSSPGNELDERNYSRAPIRRLPAEVTVDAILQATAASKQLAAARTEVARRKIAQHPKSYQARGVDYALLVFGKPLRTTNCDCERQTQPTLLQSIYRRNDEDILASLERRDGWLMEVAAQLKQPLASELKPAKDAETRMVVDRAADEQVTSLIREAYLRSLSRTPTQREVDRAQRHFGESESDVEALRDLLWALLNTREFISNH